MKTAMQMIREHTAQFKNDPKTGYEHFSREELVERIMYLECGDRLNRAELADLADARRELLSRGGK